MAIKKLILFAIIGILAGVASVYFYNEKIKPQPPIAVSFNPYTNGIYATGIIESRQTNASNINLYPEVSGKVTAVFTKDNQNVNIGDPLLRVDDSIQRQIVAKDRAQISYSQANLKNVQDQLVKIARAYRIDTNAISKNALDNAKNSVSINQQSLQVAQLQYKADKALLDQYTIKSPINGLVLSVNATEGDYASPQGVYDPTTQALLPVIQMGIVDPKLQVRCYVDEILVPRMPDSKHLQATLFVRGLTNYAIPLTFVSLQPYTIPNIQLSDERQERVDVRVLPIIFTFKKPTDINIYPGQLVDIYLKGKS